LHYYYYDEEDDDDDDEEQVWSFVVAEMVMVKVLELVAVNSMS
jgi:hypothetical protein